MPPWNSDQCYLMTIMRVVAESPPVVSLTKYMPFERDEVSIVILLEPWHIMPSAVTIIRLPVMS